MIPQAKKVLGMLLALINDGTMVDIADTQGAYTQERLDKLIEEALELQKVVDFD